ncbi:MAG: type II secretion system protein [Planctomycetes bacterium]|nr:type II secretion system protein [Planctomycetota bacterium]
MAPGRTRGFTLVELTVAIVIMGVLTLAAVPNFDAAMETANVDRGAATLHSVWLAERMYRLEEGEFTSKVDELYEKELLRASVLKDEDFGYRILDASDRGVTIRASRKGSTKWHGSLDMSREGVLSGSVRSGDRNVEP